MVQNQSGNSGNSNNNHNNNNRGRNNRPAHNNNRRHFNHRDHGPLGNPARSDQERRPPQNQDRNRRPQNNNPNHTAGKAYQSYRGKERPHSAPNRNAPRNSGQHGGLESVFKKYETMVDMVLSARSKFFEQYNRHEGHHRERIEKNYWSAIEQLKRFENNLPMGHKRAIEWRYGKYPMDMTISDKYKNNPELLQQENSEMNANIKFDDPHSLKRTPEQSLKEDREESIGTMDDYAKYQEEKAFRK